VGDPTADESSRWLTYKSRGSDPHLPAVQRYIAERAPEARAVADGGTPLELTAPASEKAHTVSASVLEGTTVRAHRILGRLEAGFVAFLDGIQESRVVSYDGGVPLVVGTVAAIVRQRRNRRLITWDYARETALYLPRAHVTPALWQEDAGFRLIDTCDTDAGGPVGSSHPAALAERAYSLVRRRRDALETGLAERWCVKDLGPLFVDGSISGSPRVGTATSVAGVVKSHRVLYVEGDAMKVVFGLRRGERSSMLRITPKWATVATWYLRIRDTAGHDPLWGLVRVEIAESHASTERADEISRWILAEASPLSMPDSRWDTMVYGIRDCEETLRAV
jgi:hypothetical protein